MIFLWWAGNKLPTNVRLSVPPGTLMTFMHGVRLKKDENWVSQVENYYGRFTRKKTPFIFGIVRSKTPKCQNQLGQFEQCFIERMFFSGKASQ